MRKSSIFLGKSEVPEAGFRWVSPTSDWVDRSKERPLGEARKRHLVPIQEGGQGESQPSAPLDDDPALFREFADLEPIEDAILQFANIHGQILPVEKCFEVRPHGENPTRGLNLTDWELRINEMKSAVALWEAAVIQDDSKAVSEWIELDAEDDKTVKMKPYPLKAIYDRIRWSLDVDRTGLTDIEIARRMAIVSAKGIANYCLSKTVVSPRLDETIKGDHLLLSLTSESLIGTMWLQFIDWVQGGVRVERCKNCKRWFPISLDTKRSHAEYCGESCRWKAYHGRRKRAYEMHLTGKKTSEIAEELGASSPGIVGKWIREAKAQEKTIRSRKRAGSKRRSR